MGSAKRDYSLLGPNGKHAVEAGLSSAEWYHTEVSRKDMKAMMRRRDGPAIRDTILWLGSMAALAATAIWLWPSPWTVPFFLTYGVLYGSASDSRWHECGHGTAFKTQWMNDAVYQIACFMIMRNPVEWRWSHARHHTDTIIVGRDPEIVAMRPPALLRIGLNVFGILDAWTAMKKMVMNAFGALDQEEETFIPDAERPKVIRAARIWFAVYFATIALALSIHSILPLLLIGTPRLYGAWHHVMTGVLQHAGLAEDVLDHRLNTRTVYINPISRFIYWNMNYHVEHHMFPMVPYYALPKLHAAIRHDLPPPDTSIWQAYREVWPALKRQLRYEEFFIKRDLPTSAKPYRAELHDFGPLPVTAE